MSLVYDFADIAARMDRPNREPVKVEDKPITLSLNLDGAALAKAIADQLALDVDLGIWCYGIFY